MRKDHKSPATSHTTPLGLHLPSMLRLLTRARSGLTAPTSGTADPPNRHRRQPFVWLWFLPVITVTFLILQRHQPHPTNLHFYISSGLRPLTAACDTFTPTQHGPIQHIVLHLSPSFAYRPTHPESGLQIQNLLTCHELPFINVIFMFFKGIISARARSLGVGD